MAVTAKPDTGHGMTLTLATTSWTGKIIGMPTNLDKQRARVQTTHLGTTTNHSYMPGDWCRSRNDHRDVAARSRWRWHDWRLAGRYGIHHGHHVPADADWRAPAGQDQDQLRRRHGADVDR